MMRRKKSRQIREPLIRTEAEISQGLTGEQAAERYRKGYDNQTPKSLSKTAVQIVWDNVFTFFNFLFAALACCLFLVGAYTDMMFLGVVIVNVLIGIVQELRVKRILDRISLISARRVTVIRDGRQSQLLPEELVIDDIVVLQPGSQVPADAFICQGTVEVNEALLTGESDVIQKREGDALLSGSFLVSGHCLARLDRVGEDSYAFSLTNAMKRKKRYRSEMMKLLDRLLKIIGIVIVPVGILMFGKQMAGLDTGVSYAVRSTVAAIVGMIPEGLYLLVSVALAVSVIRLAKTRTLVHELACIENLARVDVLCLDKTGTITEGHLEVQQVQAVEGKQEEEFREILYGYIRGMDGDNGTAQALKAWVSEPAPELAGCQKIPFSSERKWSAVCQEDGTCYLLGAPEILLKEHVAEYEPVLKQLFLDGRRVLLFAKGKHVIGEEGLMDAPEPICFLILADKLREQAKETLQYFRAQGVTVKVISGDNAEAVSCVAQRVGVEQASHFVDMSQISDTEDFGLLAEQNGVFGRVAPEQKRKLIQGLKANGHTVAMIGDGINDVLALKEADCSIAMASGSEAAGRVAQLVLLDSDFTAMPQIVKEGRRVINNIERSASLFCVKNIFSFLMAVILLFAAIPYPLLPAQITLISGFLIGAPSFLLTFEPSFTRIKGGFLGNVLLNSLPGGLANVLVLLTALHFGTALNLSFAEISTICALLIGVVELLVLIFQCWPLNAWRAVLAAMCGGGFFLAAAWIGPVFHLTGLSAAGARLFGILALFSLPVISILVFGVSRIKKEFLVKYEKRNSQPATVRGIG
ncbi:HAD-IC family P-type ATPase [Hominifimenecus sp. rT4P-3]|uniref:HAD-IC family P-type ATPase n=1 Tax=Hominifimenecus sp. rT4P-3 TaxID=3242979 RepID=UPI003DA4F8D9